MSISKHDNLGPESMEVLAQDTTEHELYTLGWSEFNRSHPDIAIAARVFANTRLEPNDRAAFFEGVVFMHFLEATAERRERVASDLIRLLDTQS